MKPLGVSQRPVRSSVSITFGAEVPSVVTQRDKCGGLPLPRYALPFPMPDCAQPALCPIAAAGAAGRARRTPERPGAVRSRADRGVRSMTKSEPSAVLATKRELPPKSLPPTAPGIGSSDREGADRITTETAAYRTPSSAYKTRGARLGARSCRRSWGRSPSCPESRASTGRSDRWLPRPRRPRVPRRGRPNSRVMGGHFSQNAAAARLLQNSSR
jgi:hypothetical protein